MEENMIVVKDPETFCFNFDWSIEEFTNQNWRI